jgi:hypothetical protein
MKEHQPVVISATELHARLEPTHERELIARQLIPTPVDRFRDDLCLRMGIGETRIEKVVVVISHDAAAAERLQRVDHLAGGDPDRRHVAKTRDLVDSESFDRNRSTGVGISFRATSARS